ncbi:hypothetical protein NEUTE1DRAFT_106479 [Neurospora tetrasperma FGSC 2508]|uniref:Uncharacterized protein n=1 Tax=Neurospora tetrasperma (strain FGSC 2508 / ATCC MYA-4615 / P0657) TaxID=510951 RepID=F8N4Z9_NEUT8|nr:uncharacterized protein NEUTE1DRAFT_106479 [Neurospora tetrasperma FGSC 2508]EGO53580.1 hypothetical protein NEUTE1DRAFT_106479 [Neurospora tetrasperma FGSC 2508]
MSSREESMDGQTSSSYSEDTSPLGEEAAYALPEDTQQDGSSETSEVSMVVHNGSISEDVAPPRILLDDIPAQNVSDSTIDNSRVASYVTECQAYHSRLFEAKHNNCNVIEDRQTEMAARLITMMRPLEGFAGLYPATVPEATEELIN